MVSSTIIVCVIIVMSVAALYFTEDKIYASHKISPVSGERTKHTVCIQDPKLNRGFIISISNVDELREIQRSLKNADDIYIIEEVYGKYYLINRRHKREQITKECSISRINEIMNKIKTYPINYSI